MTGLLKDFGWIPRGEGIINETSFTSWFLYDAERDHKIYTSTCADYLNDIIHKGFNAAYNSLGDHYNHPIIKPSKGSEKNLDKLILYVTLGQNVLFNKEEQEQLLKLLHVIDQQFGVTPTKLVDVKDDYLFGFSIDPEYFKYGPPLSFWYKTLRSFLIYIASASNRNNIVSRSLRLNLTKLMRSGKISEKYLRPELVPDYTPPIHSPNGLMDPQHFKPYLVNILSSKYSTGFLEDFSTFYNLLPKMLGVRPKYPEKLSIYDSYHGLGWVWLVAYRKQIIKKYKDLDSSDSKRAMRVHELV